MAPPPARRHAGPHLHVAGPREIECPLRRLDAHGHGVHPEPLAPARSEDPAADCARRHAAARRTLTDGFARGASTWQMTRRPCDGRRSATCWACRSARPATTTPRT